MGSPRRSYSRRSRRRSSRSRRKSRSRSRSSSYRGRSTRRSSRRGGSKRSYRKDQVGTVEKWRMDKGFGFIKPRDGGRDIFVHAAELKDGNTLKVGDEVRYDEGYDYAKRKERAENVIGSRSETITPDDRLTETCWHYSRRGHCDFGSRCEFRHVRDGASRSRSRSHSHSRGNRSRSRRRGRSDSRRGRK